MSRKLWKPLAAIAIVAAFAPAHAQMQRRGAPDPRGGLERNFAPQQAEQPRDVQPRQDSQPGRLSPEERRQLRRDIHEAGQELYRGGPPPQHPPR